MSDTKKINLRLCSSYMNGQCMQPKCSNLHFCKEFLINGNKCNTVQCKYGFSHNPLDDHNISIMNKKRLGQIRSSELIEMLRKSFPRLCADFVNNHGCSRDECNRLHLCVQKDCTRNNCLIRHTFQDSHNMQVLKIHSLDKLKNRKILISNFLISKKIQNILYDQLDTPSLSKDDQIQDLGTNDLKNVESIHSFLDGKKGVPINILYKQFPDVHNLKGLLESTPDLFWIGKKSKEYWEIRGIVRIRLCFFYLHRTCAGNCGSLHLCKDFLLATKYCNVGSCKYGFSHDINDEHNKTVLKSFKLRHISNLRSSFPRLCKELEEKGKCRMHNCGYIHICPEYILENCSEVCLFSKKTLLKTNETHNLNSWHNKTVLKNFGLELQKNDRQTVITNILVPKVFQVMSKSSLFSSQTSLDSLSKDYKKKIISVRKSMKSNTRSISSTSSITESVIDSQQNATTQKLSQLKIVICRYYLFGKCKNKTSCKRLHFCKDFLVHEYRCSDPCKHGLSHDPLDANNSKLMRKHEVDNLSPRNILSLLRNSFPRICKDYQQNSICLKNQCKMIHFCHLPTCNKDKCNKSHDLKDKHNIEILKLYSLHRVIGVDNISAEDFILSNILTSAELNVGEIIYFILSRYSNGVCPLSDTALLDNFDRDAHFAERWFRSNSNVFRISVNRLGIKIVILCLCDLRPCPSYWRKKNACNKQNCDMFHVCREYLSNESHHTNHCSKQHNLTSSLNQALISTLKYIKLTDANITSLLKIRYPFVCLSYQSNSCLDGEEFCDNLHVCAKFVTNACKEKCSLNHEIAFSSQQAVRLMESYHIDKVIFRSCLILSRKGLTKISLEAFSSLHETYEDKTINSEISIQQPIQYDSHGYHGYQYHGYFQSSKMKVMQSSVHKEAGIKWINNHTSTNNDSFYAKSNKHSNSMETDNRVLLYGVPNFAVVKSYLKTNVSPDDSCLEKVDHSKYNDSDDTHVSKGLKTVQSVDETEVKIIQKVLKDNNAGFLKLTNEFITTMLKRDFSNGVKWFEKHRDVFRLRTDRLSVKYLHLCIDEIKPCQKYWQNNCATSNCDMFHICKEYMIDSIHNKRRCHLNHDFKDSHNACVISKLVFTFLTEDNLMLLLKTRYPFVCVDYQSDSCLDGEGHCSKLHVCSDYLSGKCKKKETICKNKHDSAFLGNQASRIMEEYHLNAEEFKSCIISPKVTKKNTPYKSDKETFDCWREEAICYKFITADCDDDTLCHLLHPKSKLPYLWQYKEGYENTDEVWISFPIEMNNEMEKQFCDPVQDSWTGIKKINSVSFKFFGDYGYNVYDDAQGYVRLRRLSTKSSALTTEQHIGLTDWIWYWSEGNSKWAEYILGTSSKYIEIAYHKGDSVNYRFKTDEFDYSISFNQMIQKNNDPRYLTVRDIKRRPMFKSKEHIKAGLKVSTCVPSHWPQYYSVGEHIVVKYSTYDKIKSEFESSIGRQVTVLDIKEICNEEQYENYQRKKQRFIQKSQQANEKFLYHGTEHSVIKSICTGNFEWRLCGKNATVYGRGSYFATTASYSHNYTTKDDSNRHYMFLASVLTGKSTLGTSTMLIPPLLPASEHERYDSCVDRTCPSIYVIFHKDQCFPSYLVTYKEKAFVNHTDQMMAKDSVDAAKKYERRLKTTAPRLSNSTSTPGRVDISQTTAQPSSLVGKSLATTTSNTNIPARTPSTTLYSHQQSMNYPSKSTNYASQSTNNASQSTSYASQSTNYASQSTNNASQLTNNASQSTNNASQSTNYASQSLNYASESTNYASQSTNYVSPYQSRFHSLNNTRSSEAKKKTYVNHTDQMMAIDSVDAAKKIEKKMKITAPQMSNSTSTPGRVDISPTTAQSSSLLGKTLATTTSNTNIPARAPSTTLYSQQQSTNYPSQSTNNALQSTNYASQSTNYASQSLNYASESTNYASQSTNYVSPYQSRFHSLNNTRSSEAKKKTYVNHTDQMMAIDSVDAAKKIEKKMKITAPQMSNSTSTPGRVDISPTTAQSSSLLGKTLATTTSNTNIPARAPSTTLYSQQQSTNYPSQSTNNALQSTNYASQSANNASQSTNYPSLSTNNALQSTTYVLQSTNYPSQSTNNASQSTNYASQSTNNASQSTNYPSQSTNNASQSTNYASESANNASQSTNYPSLSTNNALQSTTYVLQSTNYPSQSTSNVSQSTNYNSPYKSRFHNLNNTKSLEAKKKDCVIS